MSDKPVVTPKSAVTENPWEQLRAHTPARIALGRAGASLPTREVLAFSVAHALAKDAIHVPFEAEAIAARLTAAGLDHAFARSQVPDRTTYLVRPDLGRRLDVHSAAELRQIAETRPAPDIVFVIGDGLSPLAANAYGAALIAETTPLVASCGRIGPVVIAQQARVALGDEVAEIFGARIVALLIGERPGLSARDSLGVYLTHAPRIGTPDSARNCISNVRDEGLPVPQAAQKLAWFIRTALVRGLTGVGLSDESETGAAPRLTQQD